MPVSVVFGGQFGSEGKGKVAHALAERMDAAAVVRVGGPNSGHTACSSSEPRLAFRQLPTAALLPNVKCVIGPGSYIDAEVLIDEIARVGLDRDRLIVDPATVLVTETDRRWEAEHGLQHAIGSTLSGTGGAVLRRIQRDSSIKFAGAAPGLAPFVRRAAPYLRSILDEGKRVIVEGTQGHGLSILHSDTPPFATSRDTSAASLLAEAGLSPVDVDDVVMVIRAFPIRVAGNSGPLAEETTWEELRARGGHDHPLTELSTVTRRPRRVALFDATVVKSAIAVNQPTRIALNHLDYIDHVCCETGELTGTARNMVEAIEAQIGSSIGMLGWGPGVLEEDGALVRIEPDRRSA